MSGSVWQVRKSADSFVGFTDGVMGLHASPSENSISVFQPIPSPGEKEVVRLQGMVACSKVVAGEKAWNKARLLLVQYMDGKPLWNRPHGLVSFDGTKAWTKYKNLFTLAPGTDELRVVAQLSRCSGTMFVKELSLRRVQQAFWYCSMQKSAWVACGCFLLFLVWPYIRQSPNYPVAFLLIAFVLAILVGVSVPGKIKKNWKNSVEQHISLTRQVPAGVDRVKSMKKDGPRHKDKNKSIDITKVGHFLFFAVLGSLMALIRPRHSWPALLFDIVLVAGVTEFVQLYIEGRSPLIGDVFIDADGGLVGILILRMIGQLRSNSVFVER